MSIDNTNTPFIGLSPFVPRVVDVPYAAFALSCVPDCTDCSSDNSDVTDLTDIGII